MNPKSKTGLHTLLAVATITAVAAGVPVAGHNQRRHAHQAYRPTNPKRDTELQREIANHNAAVEARKAEKLARKGGKEPSHE